MANAHTDRYTQYIASPEWALRRAERIVFAKGVCEWEDSKGKRCKKKGTTCHHRTYARLGHEDLDDLRIYCQHHHDIADGNRRAAKRAQTGKGGGRTSARVWKWLRGRGGSKRRR